MYFFDTGSVIGDLSDGFLPLLFDAVAVVVDVADVVIIGEGGGGRLLGSGLPNIEDLPVILSDELEVKLE
ncbi:unnamed protein product [[Candida] boidinii]|nr:unnamed protein product [[Candida] boidinii]